MIALDRQEKGSGRLSAIQELEQQGKRVISIITLDQVLEYLQNSGDTRHQGSIQDYRDRYGID
jgi:orotate phosphoribosyltransferase